MVSLIQVGEFAVSSALEVKSPARSKVYVGRTKVLAQASSLEALAERCGQSGAMHGLQYLLDQEYAARKSPHLVCFYGALENLIGAVLVFEYRLGGWPTGMLATGDPFGVRTVVGAEALRPQFASEACSMLLARGAKIVLVSFKHAGALDSRRTGDQGRTSDRLWAVKRRFVRDTLPLEGTVNETLARMGKRTRTHLRYYQRHLEKAVPCAFHADAIPLIDLDDIMVLQQLNRRSLDPISQAAFDLQVRSARSLPGGFVSGLQSTAGEWLGLAGGWRQGSTTWVQWQMNAAGHEGLSIGTAFRAFVIEDEVRRGTTNLAFHGGTSHSMSHSFTEDQVVDLVATRPTPSSRLVTNLVPSLYRRFPSLADRGNFLGDALCSDSLYWFDERAISSVFAASPVRLDEVG